MYTCPPVCLDCARISDEAMLGVVHLTAGAGYDPGANAKGRPLCRHGNSNVLRAIEELLH